MMRNSEVKELTTFLEMKYTDLQLKSQRKVINVPLHMNKECYTGTKRVFCTDVCSKDRVV